MRNARLFPLLLAITLLLTTSVFAEELLISPAPQSTAEANWLVPQVKEFPGFPDVTGTWCEEYVATVYQAGLMEGKTTERFDAASPLTYAQITVITARLHSLLNGGDGVLLAPAEGEDWYEPALDYLLSVERTNSSADIRLKQMSTWENDPVLPNHPCPREDFVNMLAAILPEDFYEQSLLNPDAAAPDAPDNKTISAFYQAGLLTGSDEYGTFYPYESLTRGAAAAILARIVDPAQRQQLTLRQLDICRDILGVEPDSVLLTLNGEPITAEVFAYGCAASGYLQNLAETPPLGGDLITKGTLSYFRTLAAHALVAENLAKEADTAHLTVTEEEEAAFLEKAAAKAGLAGISKEGWQWIVRQETIYNDVMIHYLLTYGEQGSRGEPNGYDMLSKAIGAVEAQITVEPTSALDRIDWGTAYLKALCTPCASSYSLSIW